MYKHSEPIELSFLLRLTYIFSNSSAIPSELVTPDKRYPRVLILFLMHDWVFLKKLKILGLGFICSA